eukprot:c15929_g1_i1 orf=390-584(-)
MIMPLVHYNPYNGLLQTEYTAETCVPCNIYTLATGSPAQVISRAQNIQSLRNHCSQCFGPYNKS